jgi:hypothetical protein
MSVVMAEMMEIAGEPWRLREAAGQLTRTGAMLDAQAEGRPEFHRSKWHNIRGFLSSVSCIQISEDPLPNSGVNSIHSRRFHEIWESVADTLCDLGRWMYIVD